MAHIPREELVVAAGGADGVAPKDGMAGAAVVVAPNERPPPNGVAPKLGAAAVVLAAPKVGGAAVVAAPKDGKALAVVVVGAPKDGNELAAVVIAPNFGSVAAVVGVDPKDTPVAAGAAPNVTPLAGAAPNDAA